VDGADWTLVNQQGGSDVQSAHTWVLGYVSGAFMSQAADKTLSILPPMDIIKTGPNSVETRAWDAPGLIKWVIDRCARTPTDSLSSVTAELARTLTRRPS
jgi:hypothetical protein